MSAKYIERERDREPLRNQGARMSGTAHTEGLIQRILAVTTDKQPVSYRPRTAEGEAREILSRIEPLIRADERAGLTRLISKACDEAEEDMDRGSDHYDEPVITVSALREILIGQP